MSFGYHGHGHTTHQIQAHTFVANEASLGGAHMILEDYVNLHRRAASAGPTREILLTRGKAPHSDAQRLSYNRAARRAAVDATFPAHASNLHSINRTIEGMYSRTERKKNPNDPTVYPSLQRRTGTSQAGHHQLVDPWLQGQGYNVLQGSTRPESGPTASRRREGDPYQGWSVTNSLRHTFWGDDFPLNRTGALKPIATEYAIYRQAIMGEVVSGRLYKEADLKRLFKTYLRQAPLHDKQVVEHVVADLRYELHVD